MDRRQFITLAACASICTAAGCPLIADAGSAQVIDAGSSGNYASEGVYDAFAAVGFFVVRKGGKLFALQASCTHRKATLTAKKDGTFYCRRHGSTFTADGHVTKGPAFRDLPVLATSVNSVGHLLVTLPAKGVYADVTPAPAREASGA